MMHSDATLLYDTVWWPEVISKYPHQAPNTKGKAFCISFSGRSCYAIYIQNDNNLSHPSICKGMLIYTS